jgi:hypothetical protein
MLRVASTESAAAWQAGCKSAMTAKVDVDLIKRGKLKAITGECE